MCASFQIPRSSGLMRPSGVTPVASVNTRPAPPTARLPRCTRCQSLAKPSCAGIFAHRRDDNAIRQSDASNWKWIE